MSGTVIETPRLILRPVREADRAALHAIWADPVAMADLGPVKDAAESDATIARHAGYAPLGFGVVARRDDDRAIGFVGLKPGAADTPIAGMLEIGWVITRAHWGQGYAREAAAAWLDWAWANRDEDVVWAITAQRHVASRALMAKLGMRHEPALDFVHPMFPADSPLRDSVVYRIDRQ